MHFLQANFFWYKKESSGNVTPHTHAYTMHKQRVSYAWLQAWKYIHNLPEKRQATSENMIRNMKIPTRFPFKRIPKMLDHFKAHCKEPRYCLSLSLKTKRMISFRWPMTYVRLGAWTPRRRLWPWGGAGGDLSCLQSPADTSAFMHRAFHRCSNRKCKHALSSQQINKIVHSPTQISAHPRIFPPHTDTHTHTHTHAPPPHTHTRHWPTESTQNMARFTIDFPACAERCSGSCYTTRRPQ